MKTHVILVLVVSTLLIAAGIYSQSRGGGIIARWIAAHQSNVSH